MRTVEANAKLQAADVSLVLPDARLPRADLAPFGPRRNVVVFEVPADATDLELYFQRPRGLMRVGSGLWISRRSEISRAQNGFGVGVRRRGGR